ncbi:MAG: hypothetical protein KDK97_15880 [Verrucomicrobiales bacterium]|nr:hypothetical protein [Verrucomicrobiales bacterium]MCP5557122.1 hypothetical protein [Verrucomicrobiaceae bacterium]
MDNSTSSEPGWLIFAIIGGFFVVFPLFWCGVVFLLSVLGGWGRLAKLYAAGDRAVSGELHSGVTGKVGGISYRNVLTLHVGHQGFFIEVMPLFRIGHPRLYIPWSEVSARTPVQVLWWKAEKLTLGRPAVGSITLPENVRPTAPPLPQV